MCVDLSPGNDNTVPNPYAVPEIQQALDRLSGNKLYSTFDFSSWFSQFELAEEDRDKMAFVVPGDNLTPPQIYRYKRVCFGALNTHWSSNEARYSEVCGHTRTCTFNPDLHICVHLLPVRLLQSWLLLLRLSLSLRARSARHSSAWTGWWATVSSGASIAPRCVLRCEYCDCFSAGKEKMT